MDMPTFGDRLNFLRKSKNIKAEDLAAAVGLKRRIIFLYEKNETKPSFDILLALADYFNVSLDYLVGRSDDPRRR
jgi:transcriptional regulator with XRE-family HTH domain